MKVLGSLGIHIYVDLAICMGNDIWISCLLLFLACVLRTNSRLVLKNLLTEQVEGYDVSEPLRILIQEH